MAVNIPAGYTVIPGSSAAIADAVFEAVIASGDTSANATYSPVAGGFIVLDAVAAAYVAPTATPTLTAGAEAASVAAASGTTPSDLEGSLTVTAGAAPAAGVLATVAFADERAQPSTVVLVPRNAAAATAGLYVSALSAGHVEVSAANAPAANAVIDFDYSAVV